MYRILIVDDDIAINDMLNKFLRTKQYEVYSVYSGTEAILFLEKQEVDLLILDLMLPGLTGEQVLEKIMLQKRIPTIGISAKDDAQSKINLLKNGADDYVTKPFDIDELLARIEVVLRRTYQNDMSNIRTLHFRKLLLNTVTMQVTLNESELSLTRNEYAILKLLMEHPQQVFTKDMIYERLYNEILVNSLNCLFEVYQEQVNQLQKKDDTIKETITNLAHDLRTPMTAMQGYTQMLLQSFTLSAEDLEAVTIINERLSVLNQLLNQLFLYARLEAEEIRYHQEPIDINVILRSVLVSFYQSFEAKSLEPSLTIPEDAFIIDGDENALVRVFSNIISNALVHGSGEYEISSYQEAEHYTIVFRNRAKDIEISDIDKIFDRFYTTDKSRAKKTTGLGLSISRKLVEQMNGKIIANLKNDIFTIQIEFPCKKA